MTTLPLRHEKSPNYRTLIKSSLVTALRAVFSTSYKDPQFQTLRIDPQFSLSRVTWPAMYIDYQGSARNAGVGHKEWFPDPNGFVRPWMHRIFDGQVMFDIITETPLDRDILSDALVEVLSFGTLDTQLNLFFNGIYGDINEPYSPLAVMQQIALNTDEIISTGDSQAPVPWGAEDLLLYQASYNIDVAGGFYNSIPTEAPLQYVDKVIITPYIIGDALPPDETPSQGWLYPLVYFDQDYVQGQGVLSSHEATTFDPDGIVIGKAKVSAIDQFARSINTTSVTGTAEISALDSGNRIDSDSMLTAALVSSNDNAGFTEASSVLSSGGLVSGIDTYESAGVSDQITASAVVTALDSAEYIDIDPLTAGSSDSGIETTIFIDSGEV